MTLEVYTLGAYLKLLTLLSYLLLVIKYLKYDT